MTSESMKAHPTQTVLANARPTQDGSRRRWLVRPPGVLFYLGVAFAVLQAIWVSSSIRPFPDLLGTILIWLSLASVWGLRLLGAAVVARFRFSQTELVRWLGVPVILGVVYLWAQSGGPFAARLSLSRSAMDQAATEIMAGGSPDRDWVGLWPVEGYVERLPGGVRFAVRGCGFIGECGLAYSTTGSSAGIDDPEDSKDFYEYLDGNWFIWTEGF